MDDNKFFPVVDIQSAFYNRKQLIDPPDIPSTVTNLAYTFSNCDNLKEIPEIPEKVTNMQGTFRECKKIEKISIILNSVTNMEKTFYNCSSLVGEITINSNLNSYSECFEGAGTGLEGDTYPRIIVLKGTCPQLKEISNGLAWVRVQADDLESALDYEGKAVDLDLWSVEEKEDGYNLIAYRGEIIDGKIIGTVPEYIKKEGKEELIAVTGMYATFSRNKDLKIAPQLPSSLFDCVWAFAGCTNLEIAPQLPSSLLDCKWAFAGCTNLEIAPEIPEKMQNLSFTFYECSNLVQGPSIIPSSVNYMTSAFAGCVNLTGRIEINAQIKQVRAGAPFYGVGENGKTLVITGTSNLLEKFKTEGGGPGIIIEK